MSPIQALSIGIGIAASSHTDLIMTKLENIAKAEYQRRTGIIGFLKDSMKSDNDDIKFLRAVIVYSFGCCMFYCPVQLVTQKLEAVTMRFLTPYFEQPKVINFFSFGIIRTAIRILLYIG